VYVRSISLLPTFILKYYLSTKYLFRIYYDSSDEVYNDKPKKEKKTKTDYFGKYFSDVYIRLLARNVL